jgi:hypothetical protein
MSRRDTGLDEAPSPAEKTTEDGDSVSANKSTGGATALESGTFTVIAGGEALKTYTINDLKSYPPTSLEATIASGSKEDESGVFVGAPLEKILDDAAAGWNGKYKEFIFRAEDGFASSVFASDLEIPANVLIVYEQDGAPIAGADAGGKGPLRALIVTDEFGNRSAQMLLSVEMKE